jgi:hypothetical protein
VTVNKRSEILSQENGKITEWFLQKLSGEIVDLRKVLADGIIECVWQDEDRDFIVAFYYEWDTTELFAIIDKNGDVVKRGISEIIDYVEDAKVFIVRFEGRWLGAEQSYYVVADDEWKMAVIKSDGNFLIEPKYSKIVLDEDEHVFIADKTNVFDLFGRAIN